MNSCLSRLFCLLINLKGVVTSPRRSEPINVLETHNCRYLAGLVLKASIDRIQLHQPRTQGEQKKARQWRAF